MQLATPQSLAQLLQREKESILACWERRVREVSDDQSGNPGMLRDHVPNLLDELAAQLARPDTSQQRLRDFSAAHGEDRYRNGFDLSRIVEEYKLLRSCVVQIAEAEQFCLTGDANRIIDELIDEGIKTSIHAYIQRRNSAEQKQREEYVKFLVHDLRSPLSAVYYAILLVEREIAVAPASERVATTLGVIKRNIEQMQALITKLLHAEQNLRDAPTIRIERKPIDLGAVADGAIRTLSSIAAVAQTLILNDIADGLIAHADADLLERVFQNLIANAIDNTPNGRVVVGARHRDDGGVECWVTDNGRGIPDDLKSKVFDKSANRSGGLGLPIVRQIVEAHGGAIALESAVGKGTTVRFSLPDR
ncbi:MAG: ATP-binding protein [Sulfurifustaceae bacterium]